VHRQPAFTVLGTPTGLFARTKRDIAEQHEKPVGYIAHDFSGVQGLDTSAVLSQVKLRNFCEEHDVTLAFCGLSEAMTAGFESAGFFGATRPHQKFGSRNEAIEWCEDMLLMYHEVGDASTHSFETWLHSEFGGEIDLERIAPFMQHQELNDGELLFKQGEPSDSVVFQASGCVAITIIDEHGRPIRLRRMIGHTVVGEMGFYRNVPRTANVVAEGPTVVYRLTREGFDEMQEKDPAAAAALHKLIIRLLSDRLEFANREISALL
jgi:SulP family sulfate permease